MLLTYKKPNYLTVRQLSSLVGISVSTLVLWDDMGKLVPVERTPGGWRYYSQEQVEEAKKLVKILEDKKARSIMRQNGYL